MGQNEEAFTLLRRARFGRLKQVPFRIEPHFGQVFEDIAEAMPGKLGCVLQEDPSGLNLAKDASEVGPEPSLIVEASTSSCHGEGLAGEARRDEIHDSTPRLAVKGCEIVPDRSEIQPLVCHPRHEDARGVGIPLDEEATVIVVSEGQLETELEPANPGTKSHAIHTACFASRSSSSSAGQYFSDGA